MKVDEALARLGGVADTGTLVRLTSRGRVRTAVRRGRIVRDSRGRFALPTADAALRAANALSGIATHTSAAAHWGWEMKQAPLLPTVTVPRNRKVSPERRAGVKVRWRDLRADDVWQGRVTLPGPTVTDCARTLPFDEALAIADSALRHGDVTKKQLRRLAEQVPTTGRAACLRVAEAASGKADNPFESVLRAIALGVPGLDLEPQVLIIEGGFVGRPDLVDVERRLVVEAESFEFHGKRKGLVRDCERYNSLVRRGWLVLRFTWEHVMFDPAYVAECLRDTAALRPLRQRPLRRATVAEAGQVPA